MPRKAQLKAVSTPVPQTRDEAEQLIYRMGEAQRMVAKIEAEMNDELADVKRRYEIVAEPHNREVEQHFAAVHAWAEANRASLLPGRGKTVRLTTGELSWRITPPKVVIRGVEAVLDALKRLAPHAVRVREEIDKEAIQADPDAVAGIKGISISQREEFRVKPFESQIERAVTQKLSEAA